jgi:hypothetical protein
METKVERAATKNSTFSQKHLFKNSHNNLSYEQLLAKSFYDIVQIKADRGELTRIPNEREDRRELDNLMKPGMIFGGITTLTVFTASRYIPKYFMVRSLKSKTSSIFASTDLKGIWLPNIKMHRNGAFSFREGFFLAPFMIALDAFVAIIAGFSVFWTMTPKLQLFETVADIPLLSGRSAISDTLCTDFIENYHRLPKSLWHHERLKDDDLSRNIKRFVENCMKRQQYERILRLESQIDESTQVVIPEPGVPRNFKILSTEENLEVTESWLLDRFENKEEEEVNKQGTENNKTTTTTNNIVIFDMSDNNDDDKDDDDDEGEEEDDDDDDYEIDEEDEEDW